MKVINAFVIVNDKYNFGQESYQEALINALENELDVDVVDGNITVLNINKDSL